jgi:hypothetical protein
LRLEEFDMEEASMSKLNTHSIRVRWKAQPPERPNQPGRHEERTERVYKGKPRHGISQDPAKP